MFSREDDVTNMTRVNKNRFAKYCFQNTRDMFMMGKFVKGSDFLDVGVEASVGLRSILFTDENTFSAYAGVGISTRLKEIVLIS